MVEEREIWDILVCRGYIEFRNQIELQGDYVDLEKEVGDFIRGVILL